MLAFANDPGHARDFPLFKIFNLSREPFCVILFHKMKVRTELEGKMDVGRAEMKNCECFDFFDVRLLKTKFFLLQRKKFRRST